jgi:membrane fusion protein (multidrug efflux system)
MVVGTDGKVQPRPVKVGGQQNAQWVILDGLKAGEQVMVDGFQKLRGDAPVKAVPWQAPGSKPVESAGKSPSPAASAPATAASTAASAPAASAAAPASAAR